MATQAPEPAATANKRRRIALACNACRLRKSKCDGQRPSCATCLSLNFDCQYEPSDSSTNVIVRKDYMADLQQRMAAMERTVQRLDNLFKDHLSASVDQAPRSSRERSRPAIPSAESPGTHGDLGHATHLEEPRDGGASTDGMAMTFVEERTSAFFGESSNINFTRLLLHVVAHVRLSVLGGQATKDKEYTAVEKNMVSFSPPDVCPPPTSSRPPDVSITSLPMADEMDALLDCYFDTTGALFPFLHETTMRKTYAECRDNGFTTVRRTWLGTLNMIFAMASNYDQDGTTPNKERLRRSGVFYDRAVGLCGELSKRVISLEIVQYLLLVVLYCQGTQQSVQAWSIHGLLVRSAIALGLHVEQTEPIVNSCEDESRCRTWLTIYCLDKVLSMTFGRPSATVDECSVGRQPSPWPSPSSLSANGGNMDLTGEFLAVSSRLYEVVGQSLTKQYGANMGRKSLELDEMASLQASGEFRKVLHLWASNLPSHLRICEPHSSILSENTRLNRLRVVLTLRYHNVGILIHRPLLSIAMRSLFGLRRSADEGSSYLIQLAMAQSHECIRSAESTIDIMYSVLTADSMVGNNLGVWFFNLYYVFTASLVISSRFLWSRYGQDVVDDAAAAHSKHLLEKAQTIFQKLDHGNSLVYSCAEYIRHISGLHLEPATHSRESHYSSDLPSASAGATFTSEGGASSRPTETMPLDIESSEPFPLFTSEVFDPSVFEGFESIIDGRGFGNPLWDGFAS